MWNWNASKKGGFLCLAALLIVPMWNWNRISELIRSRPEAFNRTNVELKWESRILKQKNTRLLIVPMWNWNAGNTGNNRKLGKAFNRTNVELKFIQQSIDNEWQGLLIVPMWNWNTYVPIILLDVYTFNRTNVELKSCFLDCNRFLAWSFNRTNVELKSGLISLRVTPSGF